MKNRLRSALKKTCRSLEPGVFLDEGRAAAALLRSYELWKTHSTVLAFLSIPGEIESTPLLETALTDGKRVFVPRVEGESLLFYRIFSISGLWRRGPFGIREPEGGGENTLSPGDFPALVITPGLAFDRLKKRLGRGGGYYDRFFAGLDQAGLKYTSCALCMNCQLIDEVPVENHDKKMDFVLTARELF